MFVGIYGGFFGQLLALIIVPTSYFFHFSENINYIIVMASTAFAAIVTAFIDSCAISFAAQYPESIQAGLQLGIGVSTLIGSVYRILTKALFPESMLIQSSLLYFYCGAATIICCIFAYGWLLSLPISKRVIHFGLSPFSEQMRRMRIETASLTVESTLPNYQSIENGNGSQETPSKTEESSEPDLTKYQVLVKVLWPLTVVFIMYFTTLALWPPLVTVSSSTFLMMLI